MAQPPHPAEPPADHCAAAPLFSRPVRLGRVSSTNDHLAGLAAAGAPEGTAVLAETQTAGQGRLGRAWVDVPGGSILCSLLFRPHLEGERWFLLGWLVAVSAAEAIGEQCGVAVSCKWPNDLLLPVEGIDKKVAGVLSKSVPPDGVVVGIGVNCNWPSAAAAGYGGELEHTATSLDRVAGPIDREALATALLSRCATRYGELQDDGGRAVAAAYTNRLATIGRRVRVELSDQTLIGRAVGVDGWGHLLIDDGTGAPPRAISAGDVIHAR